MVAQRQLEDTVLIVVKYWFESDSISNTILIVFREFYLSVAKGLFTCLIAYYYHKTELKLGKCSLSVKIGGTNRRLEQW